MSGPKTSTYTLTAEQRRILAEQRERERRKAVANECIKRDRKQLLKYSSMFSEEKERAVELSKENLKLNKIENANCFESNVYSEVKEKYNYIKDDNSIYGMVFLRTAINATTTSIDKNNFKTTMFDLYFKHGLVGDTTMVFKTEIRKKYYHKLEKNEKFITEARMYNEIEKNYNEAEAYLEELREKGHWNK